MATGPWLGWHAWSVIAIVLPNGLHNGQPLRNLKSPPLHGLHRAAAVAGSAATPMMPGPRRAGRSAMPTIVLPPSGAGGNLVVLIVTADPQVDRSLITAGAHIATDRLPFLPTSLASVLIVPSEFTCATDGNGPASVPRLVADPSECRWRQGKCHAPPGCP